VLDTSISVCILLSVAIDGVSGIHNSSFERRQSGRAENPSKWNKAVTGLPTQPDFDRSRDCFVGVSLPKAEMPSCPGSSVWQSGGLLIQSA
jgi:hypothetical protein